MVDAVHLPTLIRETVNMKTIEIPLAVEDALRAQSLADGRVPAWETVPAGVDANGMQMVSIEISDEVAAELDRRMLPGESYGEVIDRTIHGEG